MKIILSTLFCLTTLVLTAQNSNENLIGKFKEDVKLPYSTPSELPTVGYAADEQYDYIESDEEMKALEAIGLIYPDVTESLQKLMGEESLLSDPSIKLNAFGKFKIEEKIFLLVIATGFDRIQGNLTQSLELVVLNKDYTFLDETSIMNNSSNYDYDENGNTIYYLKKLSSNLELKNKVLTITGTKTFTTERFVDEMETLDESTFVDQFTFNHSEGHFDYQQMNE